MSTQSPADTHCHSRASAGLISFPSSHRVRCPRCGAGCKASRNARESASYLCLSADDFQSATCVSRSKELVSRNLISETQAILQKFGFGPVSGLRVVG